MYGCSHHFNCELLSCFCFSYSKNSSYLINSNAICYSSDLPIAFCFCQIKLSKNVAESVSQRRRNQHIFMRDIFILMFMALAHTSVVNTGTIHTLTPLITAIFSMVIFKSRITKVELTAYFFWCFWGTVWVVFKGSWTEFIGLELNHGDILFIGAALSMSTYMIIMKLVYGSEAVVVMTFCTLLAGSFYSRYGTHFFRNTA